ncbi:MAG: flagellar brake protein [Burkholderiales bacterium]
MTIYDKTAAPLEVADEDRKYLIRSPGEILFVLRAVMQQGAPVMLQFGSDADFISTSILEVDGDADRLVMDYGDNHKLSQQALGESRLICTTVDHQARVQFACNGVRKIRFDGRDAFGTALPDALLRVQRRESFRIATPELKPLKCVIAMPAGHIPSTVEVTLLDISCGGMAVLDPRSELALEPDTVYSRCRLDLPQIGSIVFSMRVKKSFPHKLKNGQVCTRIGCEFVEMPESTVALIQRYIIQLERETNARRKHLF